MLAQEGGFEKIMGVIHSKLVGVTYRGRQRNFELVKENDILFWKHCPDNEFDSNAILVYADSAMTRELGHLKRSVAKRFVEILQKEKPIIVCAKITGEGKKMKGMNVRVVC